MSMLRICAVEGCNVKTMGRLCLEHEGAVDEAAFVLLDPPREALEDDELDPAVSGVA